METSFSRSPRRATWLTLAASLWAPAVPAVSTQWIAPGTANWEKAANWSAGVPLPSDVAAIMQSTRSFVNLNVVTSIAGLSLSNATLNTFADLTVTGAVAWDEASGQNSTLVFANNSTVRFQGAITLSGPGGRGLTRSGVLDLAGPTTWSGNTSANGNSLTVGTNFNDKSPVLRNRGVFTDANGVDTAITGAGTFDNQGNYSKTGASVTRIDVADFRNSGSVGVTAGSLVLPAMAGVHAGNWQIGAGSMIDFSGGTPTLLGALSGGGTLRISGGTVTVEGFGHNVPMLLDGGSLAGSYQVFDGPVTWRAGTLAGSGLTLLTGPLTLDGNGTVILDAGRQVISYGQTTWSGAKQLIIGHDLDLPANFTNAGEFRDAGLGSMRGQSNALATFVNAGTYVKTGTSDTSLIGVDFDNQGTLDIRAGFIRVNTGLKNSGLIQTAAGGALLHRGGSPVDNSGTLTGDGGIQSLSSIIINRGLISPGSPIGTLNLGDLTLAPEGTLKIELGAAGAHDLLLTGTVVLGGMLELWDAGYAPQLGDSFTVLQFNTRQGTSGFDAIQLHGFGPQVAFDVLYGSGDVRLVVTAVPVPEPSSAMLTLAGLGVMAGVAFRRRGQGTGGTEHAGRD